MQKSKKLRALAVVVPTVMISSLLAGSLTTGATAADAGMGPGPKVKKASVSKGSLIDYTKQPYTPKAYASAAKV